MDEFFDRHPQAALAFSAGKDSAACLKLLRKYTHRFIVMWVNQGNPYLETVEYMKKIKTSVPFFYEIKGNQPEYVKQHGYPVDILPVFHTTLGQLGNHPIQQKFCSSLQCCGNNLWVPMEEALKRLQITGLIRGQKNSDKHQPLCKSGAVENGIEFFHPLEAWTDSDVLEFLGEDAPPNYLRGGRSSLECQDCTGFSYANDGNRGIRTPEMQVKFEQVKKLHRAAVLESFNGPV